MHGSSNLHFMQVTAPNDDVVDEGPVFGSWMHKKMSSTCHGAGMILW